MAKKKKRIKYMSSPFQVTRTKRDANRLAKFHRDSIDGSPGTRVRVKKIPPTIARRMVRMGFKPPKYGLYSGGLRKRRR